MEAYIDIYVGLCLKINSPYHIFFLPAKQKKVADEKLLCSREEMSRTSFLVVGILGILRQHP